jgi:hypothetical protein
MVNNKTRPNEKNRKNRKYGKNISQNKQNKNKQNKKRLFKREAINKDREYNEYYLKISLRLKSLKWLLFAVLVIIVCGGLALAEDLTLENINYLWRYMDILPAGRNTANEFRIDAGEHASTGYYRNNIVALKRNRLEIYDMYGRRNFTHQLAYSTPVLRVSERYILTYDVGMNKLDIFNSVSRVYEYLGEDPIFGARVTDKGCVVYITRETGYKSVIKVLDNDFSDMITVNRVNDYVIDADIDTGADYLVIAGYRAENGDYLTRISLFRTDEEEEVEDIKIRGEMPYRVKLNETGFCAVLENSIRFYDLDGEELSRYGFSGRTIQSWELGEDFSAVILNERTLGNDSRILIFDNSSGALVYEQPVDTEIMDIKFSGNYDYLYFLTRGGIYKINIAEKIFELWVSRINEANKANESNAANAANEDSEAAYDETTHSRIFAGEKNIIVSGLAKVNILEK